MLRHGPEGTGKGVVNAGMHAAAGQASTLEPTHLKATLMLPCLPQDAESSRQWGGHMPAGQC